MTEELNPSFNKFERLVHGSSRVLHFVSKIIVFIMAFFVAVDVVGRYVFNKPLKGSSDIVELMMGVVIFFALANCAQQDGHTRVDVLYALFPEKVRAYLDMIMFSASFIMFALITWQLGTRVWITIVEPERGTVTDLLQIPHAPILFLAALGSAVLCLELLVRVIRSVPCLANSEAFRRCD